MASEQLARSLHHPEGKQILDGCSHHLQGRGFRSAQCCPVQYDSYAGSFLQVCAPPPISQATDLWNHGCQAAPKRPAHLPASPTRCCGWGLRRRGDWTPLMEGGQVTPTTQQASAGRAPWAWQKNTPAGRCPKRGCRQRLLRFVPLDASPEKTQIPASALGPELFSRWGEERSCRLPLAQLRPQSASKPSPPPCNLANQQFHFW